MTKSATSSETPGIELTSLPLDYRAVALTQQQIKKSITESSYTEEVIILSCVPTKCPFCPYFNINNITEQGIITHSHDDL